MRFLVRDAAAVSDRVMEKRAFLVTDLGELARVHLTHPPRPGAGGQAAARGARDRGPGRLRLSVVLSYSGSIPTVR